MRKIIAIILCVFSLGLSAQVKNFTVKGRVVDQNKEGLIGATVVFLNPTDSVLVAFATTDNDGYFEMKRVKPAEYKFQVTYIGYGTLEKKYVVQGNDAIIDMGITTMVPSDQLLEQVEIVAEMTPVKIKKDTIEYNADAYRLRPNATVEELLKKLPGIEVDEQGTITAQGEEVKRVMVDGKKFFGDDPKMATKNLPADAIKKVQVFDKKSDRAEFTGISDGETEKTINLELKADKKIGTFGEVAAGFGSEDRFESKLALNKFNAKYQMSTLINFNNVSNQGFSFSDYSAMMGQNPFSRGGGNSGLINAGNNSGQIKSLTGGLNLFYEFSSRFNANANYFITHADQFLIKETDKENVIGTQNFFSFENADNNSLRDQQNINVNLQIKPDSFTRIDFESFFRFNYSDAEGILNSGTTDAQKINVSEVFQNDVTNSDINDKSLRLNITRRLRKPGRILSLNTTYGLTSSETDYQVDRNEYDYLSQIRARLIQEQISKNDNKSYTITAEYKEPLGKRNYLGLSFMRRNFSTDLLKDFYDIDSLTMVRMINDDLTANSFNDLIYNRAGMVYTKDHDDYNLNINLNYQRSELNWTDGNPLSNPISPVYHYFLPSLNFNWTAKNLRIRYNTSVDEPSATQLQPIVNNSDPLNLYQGNSSLKPEYSHALNIRYNFFDNFNFRNLFAFINLRYTKDKIINAQTIDDNFIRTVTPVNTKASKSVNLNVTYSTPVRKLGVKSRIFANGSISQSINFINELQNDVVSTRPRIGLELENIKNKVVSLVAGTEMTYEQNRYSISTSQNTSFTTMRYWSNLLVQFGKGWSLDGNLNHTVYSQERFGDNNTLTFINAALSKRLLKDRLTLGFKVNDMLNTGSGITRSVGDTYVEEVFTNAIGRYMMVTASYRLSAFTPQNTNMGGPPFRMGR